MTNKANQLSKCCLCDWHQHKHVYTHTHSHTHTHTNTRIIYIHTCMYALVYTYSRSTHIHVRTCNAWITESLMSVHTKYTCMYTVWHLISNITITVKPASWWTCQVTLGPLLYQPSPSRDTTWWVEMNHKVDEQSHDGSKTGSQRVVGVSQSS